MDEMVELRGGPMSGKRLAHQGGDYIYCVSLETPPLAGAKPDEPIPDKTLDHHVYRRLTDDPQIFEYQATAKR